MARKLFNTFPILFPICVFFKMSLPPLTTVYCLNFPENWLLGIDIYYFQSTLQFSGVKLIPPGTHTFHWGLDAENSRSGIFFTGKEEASSLVLLKWDAVNETVLTEADMPGLEASAIKSRLGEAYKFMIVYDELKRATVEQSHGTFTAVSWNNLTKHLTGPIHTSILPPGQLASSTLTTKIESELLRKSLYDAAKDRAKLERTSDDKEVADDEIIRSLLDQNDSELKFTEINIKKRMANPNFTGWDMTSSYLDKSWYLGELLASRRSKGLKSFLGEMQLSFLLLLIYANFSGALQWFTIVQLVLDCETAFVSNAQLSVRFLQVMKDHLEVSPPEYFGQFWDEKEFARTMLHFHENVHGPEGWGIKSSIVRGLCEDIFSICERKKGIVFPDKSSYTVVFDDEDDGPVIV